MADELERVPDGATTAFDTVDKSEAEAMTDEQLESAVVSAMGKTEQKEEPPQEVKPAEQVQAEEVESPKTEEVQGQDSKEVNDAQELKVADTAKDTKPAVQVEQQTEQQKTAFDELQAKKGFKSKEDLAKSYLELEKAFHQKRQTPPAVQATPPAVVQQPQSNPDDFNARILEDFNRDPVTTLQALTKVILDRDLSSYREKERVRDLHSSIDRLSSSPETASFNDPAIQAEMQKIYNDRPELAEDIANNLDLVYDIAEGRLARAHRASVSASAPKVKPARVEGTSQPAPARKNFDPKTASEDELEAALRNAWNAEVRNRRY